MFEQYKKNILGLNSPYTHRALKVSDRLFLGSKEIPEVAAINWRLTVIDANVSNAMAFPVFLAIFFSSILLVLDRDFNYLIQKEWRLNSVHWFAGLC